MKQSYFLKKTAVSAMLLSTLTLVASGGQGPGGTDIFHYSTKAQMIPGLEGAAGRVDIKVREQGKAAKQDLTLRLQGLQPNQGYSLILEDDVSPETATLAFEADARGRASLSYRGKVMGKADAGKAKAVLPETPQLHRVTSIQVIPTPADTESLPVLTADLGGPGQFHYQVKQTVVSTGGVRGELRILSNANTTQFRLRVTGLTPFAGYTLDLNDITGTRYPADESGALLIDAPLNPATDVLELEKIALTPAAGEVPPPAAVLTFNLP